jgi:hypothetical protein
MVLPRNDLRGNDSLTRYRVQYAHQISERKLDTQGEVCDHVFGISRVVQGSWNEFDCDLSVHMLIEAKIVLPVVIE